MTDLLAGLPSLRGVIHVGAHYGQEKDAYVSLGIERVCWVEPQPEVFAMLAKNVPPGAILCQCALGADNGRRMLHVAGNEGASSSLLPPKHHLSVYPEVRFSRTMEVELRRLANLPLDFAKFNLLVMDVQGAELEVLKGAEPVLESFDYIIAEVQIIELYEGCALLPELTEWLDARGFTRTRVNWVVESWGDALFVRRRDNSPELVSALSAAPLEMCADELRNADLRENHVAQKVVSGLWIGAALPPLAQLCIRSFQDHGFQFRLFTYGAVANVPASTLIEDASAILPAESVFVHSSGSLAHASDWFRYLFLACCGGMWTDMDVVCLKPFSATETTWFARQDDALAAIGFLAFPPGHSIPSLLAEFAADPATAMPWDNSGDLAKKEEMRIREPDLATRRINLPWGATGPGEFTKAVKHFGLWNSAAPPSSIYPIHYNEWRRAFDGSLKLEDPRLRDSSAIHLWGEMLRREPDAYERRSPDGIVVKLMERHGLGSSPQVPQQPPSPQAGTRPGILVAICSAAGYHERRAVVRETWLSRPASGIECRFFVGGSPLPAEPDVIAVPANDSYDFLPAKVRAFFRAALQSFDFDWLFKCDDDTYVDLTRLHDIVVDGHDLIGNEFIHQRGSPSGGAGYMLSRRMVKILAEDDSLPDTGPEDIIMGRAAISHGAKAHATRRLCWDTSRFPSPWNDVVTSHWCPPVRLKEIHSQFLPPEEAEALTEEYSGAPESGDHIPSRRLDLRGVPVKLVSSRRFPHRQDGVGSMLKRLGFQPPEIFQEELDNRVRSITHNHVAALEAGPPPFIILEDDAAPLRVFNPILNVPGDADAVYLGNSQWGMVGDEGLHGVVQAVGAARLPRVLNMLGLHAVLYLSEDYVSHLCRKLKQNLSETPPLPPDVTIACLMDQWNIFSVNPPVFFQDDGHNHTATNQRLRITSSEIPVHLQKNRREIPAIQ